MNWAGAVEDPDGLLPPFRAELVVFSGGSRVRFYVSTRKKCPPSPLRGPAARAGRAGGLGRRQKKGKKRKNDPRIECLRQLLAVSDELGAGGLSEKGGLPGCR